MENWAMSTSYTLEDYSIIICYLHDLRDINHVTLNKTLQFNSLYNFIASIIMSNCYKSISPHEFINCIYCT